VRWWLCGYALALLPVLAQDSAQPMLLLPDTLVRQGTQVRLPIFARWDFPQTPQRLTAELLYSPNRLRVLGLEANTSDGGLYELALLRDSILSADTAVLAFACTPPPRTIDALLGWLRVEILAGRDTAAWLQPIHLYADSLLFRLSSPRAWLRIEGSPPVEPIPIEGLFRNVPNPFATSTWLEYAVVQPGWVEFRIFTAQGKLLAQERRYHPRAERARLLFQAPSWELASGEYLVLMLTETGAVYSLRMLCAK
jgi:hypothetical protein